jgi:hypothetical protein
VCTVQSRRTAISSKQEGGKVRIMHAELNMTNEELDAARVSIVKCLSLKPGARIGAKQGIVGQQNLKTHSSNTSSYPRA